MDIREENRFSQWQKAQQCVVCLTQAGWQRLRGHGAMTALHIDRAGEVHKQRRHLRLLTLHLQQRVSIQNTEGILILVDCVGVRWGHAFTSFLFSSLCFAISTFLILHLQIRVTFRHDTTAGHVLCAYAKD